MSGLERPYDKVRELKSPIPPHLPALSFNCWYTLDLHLNWHLNPEAFIPSILGFTQILKAEEDATHYI